MVASLTPVSFQELPGWHSDNPLNIAGGLLDCARYAEMVKPYKTGALGIAWSDFEPAIAALRSDMPKTADDARAYFETHFIPFGIKPADGAVGFVTAYFEPEIEVADQKTDAYQFPFHAKPHDLVALSEADRPADLDASFAFGRQTDDGIVEYADRQAIDQGFLEGRGLEIAWAKNKTDVFFVHIQGAARLCYPDGSVRRITYAAKTGHPFTAIGRVLIDRGELSAETVSMQSIRAWLSAHPERADEVFWHNRSYIFFREAVVDDPKAGPIAAAKVPLMAGRSLAVDRLLHTFGTPFFVAADSLTHLDDAPFRRLMLAQDTGTAIVGPARGDIFTGSGAAAGELAGTVKHAADFFIFVPRQIVQRFMP